MLRAVIGFVDKNQRGATSTSLSSSSFRLLSRSLSSSSSVGAGDRELPLAGNRQGLGAPGATREPSKETPVSSSPWPSKNLVAGRRVSDGSGSPSLVLSRSFAADAARSLDGSDSPSSPTSRKTKVVPIPLAQTGEGIKECELVAWRVAAGDAVEEFGPLCEVQSDKASVEITARHAGVVERLCFVEGDMVEVGATLCELRVEAEDGEEEGAGEGEGDGAGLERGDVCDVVAGPGSSPRSVPSSQPESPSISLASPAVRRIARELGIHDLSAVQGTGPGGRVVKCDVERHVAAGGGASSSAAAAPPAPSRSTAAPSTSTASSSPSTAAPSTSTASSSPSSPFTLSPKDVVVPLRGYRRAMVSAMESSLAVPHFHFMDEYDVGALLEARRALAADKRLLESGTKLTLLPFVIKAISLALSMSSPTSPGPSSGNRENQLVKTHALVNASLSPSGDAIVAHDDHNVGVAVDTPRGLVVPVVRRVQDLSVAEVAAELSRLQRGLMQGGDGSGIAGGGSGGIAGGGGSGMLPESDLRGATITVSNIGSLGGAWATPLVHPPQAAIVALGRVRPRLIVVEGDGKRGEGAGVGRGGAGEKKAPVSGRGADGRNGKKDNSPPPSHPTLSAVPSLPMSWGADHRIVDGAGLARFAADVGALLSEPARMLLHSR